MTLANMNDAFGQDADDVVLRVAIRDRRGHASICYVETRST
jgi:hypothetical protein